MDANFYMLLMNFTTASVWFPNGSSDHLTVTAGLSATGGLSLKGLPIGCDMKPYNTSTNAIAAAAAAVFRTALGVLEINRNHASGRNTLGLVRARTSAHTSLMGFSSGSAASLAEKDISSSRRALHLVHF